MPTLLLQTLLRVHFELKQNHSSADGIACVHLLETAPSLLQEMPWLLHRDYTVSHFVLNLCTYCIHIV